jgi:hypothetical protein
MLLFELTYRQVAQSHLNDRFLFAISSIIRSETDRANMLSFIHVNRKVLERSQLEARCWLYCGAEELLEEGRALCFIQRGYKGSTRDEKLLQGRVIESVPAHTDSGLEFTVVHGAL